MTRNEWTNERLFFRLLNNKSSRTYWDNICALRRRPTKEVFERAVELTHSKDPNAREIGIDVLAQLGTTPKPFYTETIHRFFELLATEKDPKILMSLLYAIGHNNDALSKVQITKLREFGDTDNGLIKKSLVFSLLRVDSQIALDTLIELSSDRLNHIRDWATFGIGSLTQRNNKKIREALWNRVNDKHQDTRYEAIFGLAVRKEERVKDIIKREFLSGNYGTFLMDVIIEDGDKAYLPILKAHYKVDSKDKTVDADWLNKLKECIAELSKKTS